MTRVWAALATFTRMLAVRTITAAETRWLRMEVLRPGRPAADSVYPGDDDRATFHLGAFRDGALVGVASVYDEARDATRREWRLRGMATAPAVRGSGAGRALLERVTTEVAARGGGELWCNARVSAQGFYARAGFQVESGRFDIPGIGPHVVMTKTIPPPQR